MQSSGPQFRYVAGRPCLDFINTVSGRLSNPRRGRPDYVDLVEREKLVTPLDLVAWARGAGLLTRADAAELDRNAGAGATRTMARVHSLREAMYRIFKAAIEEWDPEPADLELLNTELRALRAGERLARAGRGFAWTGGGEATGFDRILRPVLRSTADLLTSDDLGRVAQCGGEDCHWLFIDTSRNQSRRWCDMAECGNRAKVRRFRDRRP